MTGRLLTILTILVLMVSACKHSRKQRTSLYEQAERHFKRGEYDAALDDYQVFIERYPQSPLTERARLRINCINREVQSMMSQKDMPEPRYVGDQEPRSRNDTGTSE